MAKTYTPNFNKFNSLFELVIYFDTEEKCRKFISANRWGDNVVCPYCGEQHCYERSDGRFKCPHCNKSFSCRVGTIFEDSNLPLRKWFMAMYLISSHKKGISSVQLSKDINVTQKTAWFLLHKIRTLMVQDDAVAICGEVECDEMYLGGKERNKHQNRRTEGTQGRSTKTKSPIFGMVQRDGNAVAMVVEDAKAATLIPIIKQFVEEGSMVYTDELSAYHSLASEGYLHRFVRHSEREFSREGISTNCIEGFWGHFVRMVFGTYHYVSRKYLQRYIDEAVYRYNTSEALEGERFQDLFSKSLSVCNYRMVKMAA